MPLYPRQEQLLEHPKVQPYYLPIQRQKELTLRHLSTPLRLVRKLLQQLKLHTRVVKPQLQHEKLKVDHPYHPTQGTVVKLQRRESEDTVTELERVKKLPATKHPKLLQQLVRYLQEVQPPVGHKVLLQPYPKHRVVDAVERRLQVLSGRLQLQQEKQQELCVPQRTVHLNESFQRDARHVVLAGHRTTQLPLAGR